jgi:hypothetical protein
MNDEQNQALARRVKRLERALIVSGTVATAVCISLAILAVYMIREARRTDPARIIRGKSFVVVDGNGRELIRLGENEQEPGKGVLEFLDGVGQRRIVVGLDKVEAPYIRLMDPAGGEALVLDVQPKLGSAIALRNRASKSGVLLAADSTGVSALGIMDSKGNRLLELGVNPDGTGRLTLLSNDGRRVFEVPATPERDARKQ